MRIDRVIDPSFRTGVSSKSGKPWVMMKVEVEGKEASIFAPASVGDEVSLTYNDQYKNYNAEKMTPQKQEKAQLEDTLKTILSSLGRIEQHLGINTTHRPEPTPGAGVLSPSEKLTYGRSPSDEHVYGAPDLPPVDVYDEGAPY